MTDRRELEAVFPWARHLPDGDFRQFAADIAAWEATAEAYADPDTLAALRAPIGDYGPVPEPPDTPRPPEAETPDDS